MCLAWGISENVGRAGVFLTRWGKDVDRPARTPVSERRGRRGRADRPAGTLWREDKPGLRAMPLLSASAPVSGGARPRCGDALVCNAALPEQRGLGAV